LAEEEHVLPWAVARLRLHQTSLAPDITERLKRMERDAAIAAFYWSSELKGVLRAFSDGKLAVVPLKGPLLAERLYGSAALRVSRDLDLLVARADLARAEAILGAIGFVPGIADDYHRAWYRETTTVELHHDVENPLAFEFGVESALRRAQPAVFQGEDCRQFAAEDEVLLLCLHAARHRFERMSLVLDLQLAFERLTGGAEKRRPRPEAAELGSLLTLGLAMARRLQPETAVGLHFDGSRRESRHLERLADRLWDRLLTQASEPLDWRALHGFYVEMEFPGWRRLHRRYRHMQILLGRAIEPDYAFARRFGLERAWQVRMLRPVRLFSEFLRR
jgi:hypothetical protein